VGHIANKGEMRITNTILVANSQRYHLGGAGVNGRIILK
jgi:hypothetical protein